MAQPACLSSTETTNNFRNTTRFQQLRKNGWVVLKQQNKTKVWLYSNSTQAVSKLQMSSLCWSLEDRISSWFQMDWSPFSTLPSPPARWTVSGRTTTTTTTATLTRISLWPLSLQTVVGVRLLIIFSLLLVGGQWKEDENPLSGLVLTGLIQWEGDKLWLWWSHHHLICYYGWLETPWEHGNISAHTSLTVGWDTKNPRIKCPFRKVF